MRKTILFVPLDGLGHIHALRSLADPLRAAGHRTVFLFLDPVAVPLREHGHEVYDCTTPGLAPSQFVDVAQDKWTAVIEQFREVWRSGDAAASYAHEMEFGFGQMAADIIRHNEAIAAKVALIRPDLIVIDHYFAIPALFKAGVPWVRVFSASPLGLHDDPRLPMAYLGLPSGYDPDDAEARRMVTTARAARERLYHTYNAYWRRQGMPEKLPPGPPGFMPKSPWLNLYMYPEELDYEPPLPGWVRCDAMVRDDGGEFAVPARLRDGPGKLIFLSMGSVVSADLELMRRLVASLADAPHRFIVAKGPLHARYDLPDNMWGEAFVPQLQVLKQADLMITHGGNNSVTEALYFGTPGLVVCPICVDQLDNAQRIEEKGLGVRLDPFHCTRTELLAAIERVLGSTEIAARSKAISARMQRPEVKHRALRLVDDLLARLPERRPAPRT